MLGPFIGQFLTKKVAVIYSELIALIRPIIKLLNKSHIIIIGDREFHSIELATWLKKEKKKGKKVDFAFRQKQGSFYHKGGGKYVSLSEIEIEKGVKQIKMGIKVTKKKGFSSNNLAIILEKHLLCGISSKINIYLFLLEVWFRQLEYRHF